MAKGLIRCAFLYFVVEISLAGIAPPYNLLNMKVKEYILPIIPYEFESFEPYIDGKTMEVHMMGHHNAYKTKTNDGLKAWRNGEPDNELAKESILRIVQNLTKVPEKYRTLLKNNGGGFVNHCFYFGIMSPNDNGTERTPTGELLEDINAAFGDVEGLKKEFFEGMKKLFGSGYVWLSRRPGAERPNLEVLITSNQDSPVSEGLQPILVLDLWEHAYYLKHNYRKWEHLKDFWMVVDWKYVNKLDQWWKNLDKEEKAAEQRVDDLRENMAKRAKEEAAKKSKDEPKKSQKEEKKQEL